MGLVCLPIKREAVMPRFNRIRKILHKTVLAAGVASAIAAVVLVVQFARVLL
jgi:hypothetical protein